MKVTYQAHECWTITLPDDIMDLGTRVLSEEDVRQELFFSNRVKAMNSSAILNWIALRIEQRTGLAYANTHMPCNDYIMTQTFDALNTHHDKEELDKFLDVITSAVKWTLFDPLFALDFLAPGLLLIRGVYDGHRSDIRFQ